MKYTKYWLLSAAAVAAVSPVNAQTAPASSDQADKLDVVIVTAERREADIQDVPISMAVYSGDDLADRGVSNIRALTTIDPSVNMTTTGGHNTISVRGITSSNATETGEPAVGFATDGIFNNRSYSLGATMYDIARVEILRGPQGTLFGRNTTGGVVNIVSNRPTSDYSGRITVDVGNYAAQFFDGFLNVPLTDNLNTRLSFSSRSRDGYQRSTDPLYAQRVNDEQNASARLQFAYAPTDDIDLWFSAGYTREGGLGAVSEAVPFRYAPGAVGTPFTSGPTAPEWLHDLPPNISDGESYPIYGPAMNRVETMDYKWSASWSLPGDLTLDYLGGYNRIDYVRASPSPRAGLNVGWTFTRRENPSTYNNEIRLSSSGNEKLVWQVGLYHFLEESHLFTTMVSNAASSSQALVYLFDTPFVRAESVAGFGQASYNVTDQLKFTIGGRYTEDDKERRGIMRNGPAMTPGASQNGKASSDKFTWLASADYDVTPDNLVYLKASTGYKGGGFTSSGTYEPETMTSYEFGSKNEFFDGSLQLNIAAYLMKYEKQQVNQYVQLPGSTVSAATTVNAGESEIKGVEASLVAALGDTNINVAANYLDATYKTFLQSAPWNGTLNLDLAGNSLPVSPEWAVSAGLDHSWKNIANGDITARIDASYKGEQFFSPLNFPSQRQEAVTIFDLSLDYRPTNAGWRVQAYVNNATDEKRFVLADETTIYYTYIYSYGAPRTYGVRLTADF